MSADQIIERYKGDSQLVRAHFGPGMILQSDDLELLGDQARDLSRLLFRSLFGCGVVCGLVVSGRDHCGKLEVTINPGVALGCNGDPIHVPKKVTVVVGDGCRESLPESVWVVLCATSKTCGPRDSSCGCDDDDAKPVHTRERLGFEIRILDGKAWPECVCGCEHTYPLDPPDACQCANPMDPCYSAHYRGECGCECGDCCERDCKCVMLAKLTLTDEVWQADHKVRRFVRPLLMQNPLPENATAAESETPTEGGEVTPQRVGRKRTTRVRGVKMGSLVPESEERDR